MRADWCLHNGKNVHATLKPEQNDEHLLTTFSDDFSFDIKFIILDVRFTVACPNGYIWQTVIIGLYNGFFFRQTSDA